MDVTAWPVTGIPEGGEGVIIESIKVKPGGTAGTASIDLAKLGAEVTMTSAIGNDFLGDLAVQVFSGYGVDTSTFVRRDNVQTSASVIPIRPDGSRPALHVVGANSTLTSDDAPWDVIAESDQLYVGAPEFIGGEESAKVLRFAREHGVVTAVDFLIGMTQIPAMLADLMQIFPYVDYVIPNDVQLRAMSGTEHLEEGCRTIMGWGAGTVAVTRGGDGAMVVAPDAVEVLPAFEIDVVDTTGCGDAFSSGFLRGIGLGRSLRDSALLGSATAAQVAQGMGGDYGEFTLDSVDEFARTATTRSVTS